MGLDLHLSDKPKSTSLIETMGPQIPLPPASLSSNNLSNKKDHADFYWTSKQVENGGGFGEKPSISEFNIMISSNSDSKNDFHFSTLPSNPNNNHCQNKRSNSVYELPIENCFFTAGQEPLNGSADNVMHAKKSVRFSDNTIFIERDMDSPFWKEFTDRKMRRRMLREQRRERRQNRSVTLFDLLRIMFTSSGKKTISSPKISTNLQKNLKHQHENLSRVEDFNSNFSDKPGTSDNHHGEYRNSPTTIMPLEFGSSSVRKNSKMGKILRSIGWWGSSSGGSSQQSPSITSIQPLQIN